MRKPWLIGTVLLLAAVVGLGLWLGFGRRREWTTDSAAALVEYRRGRQAQMRYYASDARPHFEKALALDPQFTVARLALLDAEVPKAERERLLGELRAADLDRLTERERFLVRAALLAADGKMEERGALVDRYLADHPRDAWALWLASGAAWNRQDYPRAEERYQRLLDLDPNWVMARNNLGYIAMAQGRFAEAEQAFQTYAFVAPDQANPHDSLGELYVLRGRYEEARRELETAVAIRPDFCASYQNLMRAAILERRPELLDPLVARIERHCSSELTSRSRCSAVAAHGLLGGDWEAPWRDPAGACARAEDRDPVLIHTLALLAGRAEEVRALEEALQKEVATAQAKDAGDARQTRAVLLYLEGARLARDGEAGAAVAKLRQADDSTAFWELAGPGGILKLLELHALSFALEDAGRASEAQAVRARLRDVNPSFAEWPDLLAGGASAGARAASAPAAPG